MTTYTGDHLTAVWKGDLAAAQDRWVCTTDLAPLAIFDPDAGHGQVLADGCYNAWATNLFGTAAAEFGHDTALRGCDVYLIDHVTGRAKAQWSGTAGGTVPVGTGATSLPAEVALCVTKLTGFPGRSKRGRMYLPGLSASCLSANGFVSGGPKTSIVNACQAFWNDLNSISDGDIDSLVDSVVWSDALSSGTSMTAIRVGDVFDSQRRRRRQTPEGYTTATIDPPSGA